MTNEGEITDSEMRVLEAVAKNGGYRFGVINRNPVLVGSTNNLAGFLVDVAKINSDLAENMALSVSVSPGANASSETIYWFRAVKWLKPFSH